MMVVALAIEAGAAVVLTYAGAWKLARPEALEQTLAGLQFPASPLVVATIGILEISTAALLVLAPGGPIAAVAVVTLAVAFAGAGCLALIRGLDADCGCFGPGTGGKLGFRQILLLPLWLLVALTSALDDTPMLGDARPQLLTAIALILAIAAIRRLEPLAREHAILRRLLEGRFA